jgi:hypothetical protein
MARQEINMTRVEAPKTDHFIYFAPDLEKYEGVQFFPCMKIEIGRVAKNLVIYSLD